MEKLKSYRWISVIFFIYMVALSGSRWNAVYSISCGILWGTLLWSIFKTKRLTVQLPEKYFNLVYWPFFICIIISSLVIGDIPSIKQAFDYLYWSLPFILLLLFYQSDPKENLIFLSLSIALIIIGGTGIWQYIMSFSEIRISGLFGHPNHFATMVSLNLSFLVGCLLYRNIIPIRVKSVMYLACIIGAISLIFSGSRGAMLGFLVGGAITVGIYYGKHIATLKWVVVFLCAAMLCIGGMQFLGNNSQVQRSYDSERIKLLESSYHMWQDHLILGVGLKNWGTAYQQTYILPEAKERTLNIPHNVPAYFFSATGTISGLSYLVYTFGIYTYLYKKMKQQPKNIIILACMWALAALTIHGLVDVGIMMEDAMRLYSGLLGITVASIIHSDKENI